MIKDIIPLISSAVTGLFAITTAVLAWKLNSIFNKSNVEKQQKKIQREELIELYSDIYATFEIAIRQIKNYEEFSLYEKFTRLNARIHLLAPDELCILYFDCCESLTKWSELFKKSSLPRTKIGDEVFITFQSPDPTEKYKKYETEAYEKLIEKIQSLTKNMKIDLSKHHDKTM
ncbi:TPA: hypothetical protein L9U06_005488 [Klebsiella pneumoniae]|uniref:hypothetical protein n=1 Tax=Klebsiella pneumoniae TaxID=573 RepID=UPI000FE1758E|nr:hypothetical protein [Klebsiella pneumoniae]QAA16574.1 hypothetical protein C0067_17010 [Klebsiella pneumoniae]HBR4018200.1 hypothetical protein [Klebsiella pneumoniae]HDY8571694.1 hypothetical protein [Klebsiella pneumoniae]